MFHFVCTCKHRQLLPYSVPSIYVLKHLRKVRSEIMMFGRSLIFFTFCGYFKCIYDNIMFSSLAVSVSESFPSEVVRTLFRCRLCFFPQPKKKCHTALCIHQQIQPLIVYYALLNAQMQLPPSVSLFGYYFNHLTSWKIKNHRAARVKKKFLYSVINSLMKFLIPNTLSFFASKLYQYHLSSSALILCSTCVSFIKQVTNAVFSAVCEFNVTSSLSWLIFKKKTIAY